MIFTDMEATKNQIRNCWFSLLLYVAVFVLGAQEAFALNDITVRLYDEREIIAGSYTVLCQDTEGFIWIGSNSGLRRFDGNRCDVYLNDELDKGSVSDNMIISLFCDSRGNIWVGTANGLNYYDAGKDSFRLVKLPGKALNGFITDIMELPDGRILFLVAGIGLYTINGDALENGGDVLVGNRYLFGFNDDSGISRVAGKCDRGTVFSTRSGEVCLLTPEGKVERVAKVNGNVSNITQEDSETFIIATQYEAFRLNLADGSLRQLGFDGNRTVKITDLHSDGGVTYFATAGDGIWSVAHDGETVRGEGRLTSSSIDLSSLKVGCVFTDRQGNLWFGCGHRGVAMAPSGKGPVSIKSLNDILRKERGAEVTCMTVSGPEVVIGLNNGTVFFLNKDDRVRRVSVSSGAPVTSLATYPGRGVLVGVAREGIWCIDQPSLSLTQMVRPSKPYPGVVIASGSNGEIIAAFGELGVLRYDPVSRNEKWFYPAVGSNQLSCFYYAGIKAASKGRIWIGGYSGIACYDTAADSLVPIDQTPFFKGVVNDICECGNGVLLATDTGLILYSKDGEVSRKYTKLDGLPDNNVRTLTRDDKGGVWIGTMKGLAYYKEPDKGIRAFGGLPGLSRTEYTFSDRLLSGRIVMGNFESLTVFHPDSLQQPLFGGNVKVTGIYLNGQRITSGTASGARPMIEGSPSNPIAVYLNHKDNALVLRLSTMDFREASDLRYEWQIEGDGDKWHATSPGESLIYLPPLDSGRHIIRIRGCENDVVSEVSELKIDVKAPWYQSNMAYGAYLMITVLICSLIYKVVKNKREEEMYEAKIRYFMDISHELRSPVTLMISPVETLLKQEHSPETTSQLLTVRRNAQRVLNLVDQLLDIRKIEKGKMRLVFKAVDIKAFVEELVDMFRPMAEDKGVSIYFESDVDTLWAQADRDNLDKILVNLISNAIKYTPKGGRVTVNLSTATDPLGNPRYVVTVTDTGIGLDSKMISHLFERFYRNREHHHGNASGFGIGLDLCMRLVGLHKGDITARNREDGEKGSVFSVSLPLLASSPGSAKTASETVRKKVPIVVGAANSEVKSPKSSYRFRILVVDDDTELREYIRQNLGSAYKVTAVGSGEEALKELGERVPDLIFTDIRMGGIDGLELLRRVKSNMSTQHVPVILCSSANGTDERTKGWKRGADGYLAKPFTIDELEGMVSGLLETRNKLKGKFSGGHENVDKISVPKMKGMDEDLMEKVNNFINSNLSESTMNVDDLSEYVGLSRSQLHRRMKEIVGVAPSDYIRNVRLRKAREMLAAGDVDIAQVAYSLGFNAQSHFSTLFKKYTGLTPSEYRSLSKDGRLDVKDESGN